MPRNTFPYSRDRMVIHAFLMVESFLYDENDTGSPDMMGQSLYADEGKLRWAGSDKLVCSWDSAGALVFHGGIPGLRVANYILEILGVPREDHIMDDPGRLTGERTFIYAGRVVRMDDPITLVGPMLIEVYRAKHKLKSNLALGVMHGTGTGTGNGSSVP